MQTTDSANVQYGYGERLSAEWNAAPFRVLISNPSGHSASYLTALVKRATELGKSANGNICLCLSGGIDSEVMARAFLLAGIPFQAVLMKLKGDFNSHDIQYAQNFCRKQQIPLVEVELDSLSFFESGQAEKYLRYGCNSPLIATHLWLAEKIEGVPVFAGSAVRVRNLEPFLLSDVPGPNQFALDNLLRENARFGVSNFLFSSPEMISSSIKGSKSILSSGYTKASLQSAEKLRLSDTGFYAELLTEWLAKFHFFCEQGFPLIPRASKFTGFERVHYYYGGGDMRIPFHQQNPWIQWKGLLRFNQYFRAPLEEKVPKARAVELEFSNVLAHQGYAVTAENGTIQYGS